MYRWESMKDQPATAGGLVIAASWLAAGVVSGFAWYGVLRVVAAVLRASGVSLGEF